MLARTDLRAAALRIGARVAAFVLLLWLAFELAGYGLQAQNMAATAKLPTDAELERAFARGQAEFQRLVQMANEDANVWRIALDFAYADSKGVGERTVTADPNLPPTRWEEYRRIFRHLGLRSGLIRETISAKEGIYFPAAARQVGTVDSEEKGFAYMFGEPSPIVPSLDVLTVVPKSPQPAYRKLNGSWYLYWRYNE